MLSGPEIRIELERGDLVIDPPLTPQQLQDLGVAIEFTLHNVFHRSILPVIRDVDVVVNLGADPYEYMKRETLDEIIVQPHQLVLGETAEKITIPLHLCGWIEGKSGRARSGLEVHLTAPKVDPGWGVVKGPKRITLEIVNNLEVPMRLRPGAAIAQMLFHRLGVPAEAPYQGTQSTKGT